MTGIKNMQQIGRLAVILVGAVGPLMGPITAIAQTDPKTIEDQTAAVVVEYFMSQSCSSCMATSDFFSELAARDDIVALSWHVDYWNILTTKNGSWVDPYSSADYTARQRRYNKTIRHRSSVYTPQMVIAGASEASGRSPAKVNGLIDAAKTVKPVNIRRMPSGDQNEEIIFEIDRSEEGGNAYLVSLMPQVTTKVAKGENAGHIYTDINVVTGLRKLGVVLRSGVRISVPRPAMHESCAILIQEPKQGRIIAAAYCSAL